MTFEAPIVSLEPGTEVLELFHGPSMAFKDFGARFMAAIMSHYLLKSKREIRILVATSGDTGGAVAQGFYNTPGISVTILYPTGKVSDIQEKQLTTLGGNVTALEIDGTFDDCQRLVKQAFLDEELRAAFDLASANSINISRLIPQSFYYFAAYAQAKKKGLNAPVVFSVPSGNFGNLSAGLMAYRMGLPVKAFVASCNENHPVADYLRTGDYNPVASVETLSNAMDVSAPNNWPRVEALLAQGKICRDDLEAVMVDEEDTQVSMRQLAHLGYVSEPHAAIAYKALRRSLQDGEFGIFLGTAHPAKFKEQVENILGTPLALPEVLARCAAEQSLSRDIDADYAQLKQALLALEVG